MLTRYLTLFILLVLGLAGCRRAAEPPLQVGRVAYSADQVAGLSPELLRSLADLTAFAEAVAREELYPLGAPIIERGVERSRVEVLPLYLAARELGIGDAELRAAYAQQPEWELTVRHVVRLVEWRAPQEERTAAWTEMEEVRRRALAGEDFAALAAQFSDEPGAAERGGALEPGREGSWVAPFWEAARALQPGEISPVVETEYGFHVIRLDDRRPVPFEQADRTRLLRQLVPQPRAIAAMERWVAEHMDALEVDPRAVLAARERLPAGEAPDTIALARWAEGEGGRYTARDLAVFRAALDGEEREALDRAGDDAFVSRVEGDAREAMWAASARSLDVPARAGAEAETTREWEARVVRWAAALGLRGGMGEGEIRDAALRALRSRGQEARITRLDIEGVRPLLWDRYEVSGDALPASAALSSSDTGKRVSTR